MAHNQGIVKRSSSEEDEAQFRRLFGALLKRTIQRLAEEVGRAPESPFLSPVDRAFFDLFGEMQEWPETKESLTIAARSPALQPLTFSAAGVPHDSIKFWLNFTLYPAIKRYRALGPPNVLDPRRVARVVGEVVRWTKIDGVEVITLTPLYGIRILPRSRLRVERATIIRAPTQDETAYFYQRIAGDPGRLVHGGTPCLVTTQKLPRLQSPTVEIPVRFMQSLQLVLGAPLVPGESLTRPAAQAFSLTNQEFGSRRLQDMESTVARGVEEQVLARSDVRRARAVTSAFQDLSRPGFDLALDLYVTSLHRSNTRERAVNIAIALENLYLQNVRDELRYRFSLHVVAFGRRLRLAERVEMKTAKDLYDARSSVVHGGRADAQIKLLNSTGARLVRSTLMSIVSERVVAS